MATSMLSKLSFLKSCLKVPKHCRFHAQSQSKLFSAKSAGGPSDPGQLFIRKDVQDILNKVTGFNLDKIFPEHFTTVHPPKYKMLTDEELHAIQEESINRGQEYLQMPPVLSPRVDKEVVLSNDPEIAGVEKYKLIFTDITYGMQDQSRVIAVREPEGKLRLANSDERDRFLHTYFPRPSRMYNTPKMFTDPHLEDLLNRERYEYILDRACVQFEPDNHQYIAVCHRTYDHVAHHNNFQHLWSTRHFGPMTFYLAYQNKCEGLIADTLQRDLLTDAADIVSLYSIIHPNSKSAELIQSNPKLSPQQILQTFAEHDAAHGGTIQLAIQSYIETQNKPKMKAS